MKKLNDFKKLKNLGFMAPATYRIKVQGNIDSHLLDYLNGMKLVKEENINSRPISILKGELRDQSALSGILNSLYNMHFAIISVEQL